MPGFDKTGPQGQGPMTGGGRGRCAARTQSFGFGFGRGQGRGRRLGRGFAGDSDATRRSELSELKAQVSSMGDMIASLSRKVGELMKKNQP